MAEKLESTVHVITGNRLADGRVVYLRADRTWGADFDAAWTLTDAGERDALLAWAAPAFRTEVTGIYAFDVGIAAGGRRVISAREQLRAQGEAATRRRMRVEGFGS